MVVVGGYLLCTLKQNLLTVDFGHGHELSAILGIAKVLCVIFVDRSFVLVLVFVLIVIRSL